MHGEDMAIFTTHAAESVHGMKTGQTLGELHCGVHMMKES